MNITNPVTTPGIVHGWVSGPNGRGTFSILWSCILTNFLCGWAVLCLNVPAPNHGLWTMIKRKTLWLLCVIIGPEVTLTLAVGQYCSARRSVADFRSLKRPEWTLEHAFFADMGGIMLSAPRWHADHVEVQETMTFPVNAQQLYYLVKHGYLEFPTIPGDTISDKSKNDNFARCIVGVQVVWFMLQCLSRLVQHLPLTTLELSTVGVVFSTLPVFWCWLRKPADVALPVSVTMSTPIAQILVDAGKAAKRPWDRTPLDFVCMEDWNFDLCYNLGMQKVTDLLSMRRTRPLNHFSTADFPIPETWGKVFIAFFQLSFGAIHLAGWNFFFPTRVERVCWRCASCIFVGCCVYYWTTDIWVNYLKSRATQYALKAEQNGGIENAPDETVVHVYSMKQIAPVEFQPPSPKRWETLYSAKWRTFPLSVHASYSMPIGYAVIIVARLYTVVEVFASFRTLPQAIYDDVQWTGFIPHFGA